MFTYRILFLTIVALVTSCTAAATPTPLPAPPTAIRQQPSLTASTRTPEATGTQTVAATVIRSPTAKPTATKINTSKGPYDEGADAKHDIAEALADAKIDRKNVLLDFGANWCPDCVVLSKIFEDSTVSGFLEADFHVIRIDVGNWDKNLDISQQYGKPIDKGIPAVVVLDPDNHIVATTKGGELANARYSTKQQILDMLRQWAPRKP